MTTTMHAPRWRRLLDGGRSWGSLDVYPARYGVARYRLVVFPPGLSPADRTLLRASRSWRVWGTVLWLLLEVFLVPTVGSGHALIVSSAVWLVTGASLAALTGAHRAQVRTMSVVRMPGIDDVAGVQALITLRNLVEDLTEADRKLAAGELNTVQHEAVAWRVYDQVSTVRV